MSKKSLRDALQKMETHLTERLVDFSARKVKEMSEQIKKDVEKEYDKFFALVLENVIGASATPGLISSYTKWDPLSEKWIDYKATNQYYIGLSNSLTTGNALGRRGSKGISRLRANGPMPKGLQKVGSFRAYIQSLNTAGTTERFFGPVSIGYDFISPSANITIKADQKGNVISALRARSVSRGVFVSLESNVKSFKMKATISAFGKLKGVPFNEWDIVDFIIKRIDTANEKQWVKINSKSGFGRRNRPIRAVITPILRYYLDKALAQAVQNAVQSRS